MATAPTGISDIQLYCEECDHTLSKSEVVEGCPLCNGELVAPSLGESEKADLMHILCEPIPEGEAHLVLAERLGKKWWFDHDKTTLQACYLAVCAAYSAQEPNGCANYDTILDALSYWYLDDGYQSL